MKQKRKYLFVLILILLLALPAQAAECNHDFQLVEVPPTCEEAGYRGYVCSLCFQTKDYEVLPQLTHDWGAWSDTVPATCTQTGLRERQCNRCQELQQEETPRAPHSYNVWVQPPTCGRAGYTLHTCELCGHEEKTDRIEALGHDLVELVVPAKCTTDGYTKYQCTRCTYTRKENPVERTGHTFDDGIITKAPGVNQTGKRRYTCQTCGETKTETLPPWTHPFSDVQELDYFRDSVIWAYHTGITTGAEDGLFLPEAPCTRSQVVTFLWRWAGQPEVSQTALPFSDVPANSYYYQAVAWAVGKGITKGMDATHFAPDEPCTRSQVVTLLHRFLGFPAAKGQTPFVDVPVDAYYAQAVLWAYKANVTTGADRTHFLPAEPCTRGQIVSFLYRANQT